jgi:hypothetical protein
MDRKNQRTSKFDRLMMAISFAEAGDADTARNIMGERPTKRNQKQNRREIGSRIDHRPRLYA